MSEFKWTAQKEEAALLVARDELSDEHIAGQLGIARKTLARWKKAPEFGQRVISIVEETRAALLASGISERCNRLDVLNDFWKRLRIVADERAADPTMAKVPGGKTGLLVRTLRTIGSGEHAEKVEEFTIDGVLLKELRAGMEQAAKEIDGSDLDRRLAALEALAGTDGGRQ